MAGFAASQDDRALATLAAAAVLMAVTLAGARILAVRTGAR